MDSHGILLSSPRLTLRQYFCHFYYLRYARPVVINPTESHINWKPLSHCTWRSIEMNAGYATKMIQEKTTRDLFGVRPVHAD